MGFESRLIPNIHASLDRLTLMTFAYENFVTSTRHSMDEFPGKH